MSKALKTSHYKNEYSYFYNQITENRRRYQKAKKEAERFRMLHDQDLASLSDLEYKELELEQAYIKRGLIVQNQLDFVYVKHRRQSHNSQNSFRAQLVTEKWAQRY